MIRTHAAGFAPVFESESVALVLGSFPSVKSRAVEFYYGNPQNRFWRTVCSFFGEPVPADTEGKRDFLFRRKIALWDVITECDIEGSSDSSIRSAVVADVPSLLAQTKIKRIFCNGSKAYGLLFQHFPQYVKISTLLPSTSPANPRFSAEPWQRALEEIAALGERGKV